MLALNSPESLSANGGPTPTERVQSFLKRLSRDTNLLPQDKAPSVDDIIAQTFLAVKRTRKLNSRMKIFLEGDRVETAGMRNPNNGTVFLPNNFLMPLNYRDLFETVLDLGESDIQAEEVTRVGLYLANDIDEGPGSTVRRPHDATQLGIVLATAYTDGREFTSAGDRGWVHELGANKCSQLGTLALVLTDLAMFDFGSRTIRF